MHSHDVNSFTFYVHSKTTWLAETRFRAWEGQQRRHGTPMNVHRKPISEMSTVCCGTCQTARGSRHSVGKLKVGSATIEGFRLTLPLCGCGPCSRFSEDITRNRMQVCWISFLGLEHARFVRGRSWLSIIIIIFFHVWPGQKKHFPSPARIMSLGGKHI